MRSMIRKISLLAPLALATVALAQAEKPPEPSFTPQTNPVVGYLVMAVLVGLVLTVSLIPSKRSHTDT